MRETGATSANPERDFLDHLPVVEQVIGIISRRHALTSSDADEFASWARARLIDNDYAVFQKFAGRSSMRTYLSVVLGNLFLDYRNSAWGRWRPSAAATRLGAIGIRLEELLHRDGSTMREAIEVLHSAGCELTDLELGRMSRQLPARAPASEVPLAQLEGTIGEADPASFPTLVTDDEFAILRAAIEELPPEDQVIIRMRFWNDESVADIARALRLEQKPLYRRIEQIETRLRKRLGERGVDRERAQDVLSSSSTW